MDLISKWPIVSAVLFNTVTSIFFVWRRNAQDLGKCTSGSILSLKLPCYYRRSVAIAETRFEFSLRSRAASRNVGNSFPPPSLTVDTMVRSVITPMREAKSRILRHLASWLFGKLPPTRYQINTDWSRIRISRLRLLSREKTKLLAMVAGVEPFVLHVL